MIFYDDYKNYYQENNNFLELLKENNSILYTRLKDVVIVLEYIANLSQKGETIDEDLEVIFETGFSYLHEQLELIKVYYTTYFKSDFILFYHYEVIINYLLYLDDLAEVLSGSNLYNHNRKQIIESLVTEMDLIIKDHTKYTDSDLERYNMTIEECVPPEFEVNTTDVIFSYILEELNI